MVWIGCVRSKNFRPHFVTWTFTLNVAIRPILHRVSAVRTMGSNGAGILPAKSVIQWRSTFGQDCPSENTGKIVALAPYFERGLGLPCSAFFTRLLSCYKIQRHCNTRFIKEHKPSNHIRARIKSHVYTTEWTVYHSTYHVKRYNKSKYECYLLQ